MLIVCILILNNQILATNLTISTFGRPIQYSVNIRRLNYNINSAVNTYVPKYDVLTKNYSASID